MPDVSFDALTLSAVRDELTPLVVDGRIQKVGFPDEMSLAIEVFKPGTGRIDVLLSAHAEQGRVQRLTSLPTRGLEGDTPFSLLARKHLRNARILSISQPPLERVLELGCEQRDASGQHYKLLLIVEVMGRRSNLVLVADDGAIMDAARRSPPSRNPRRPILPHLRYEAPPPQNRLLPHELTAQRLSDLARGRPGTLAKLLGDAVAGLSPQAARELAFRATGSLDTSIDDVDWPQVVRIAREFLEPPTWEPCVALADGHPLAYAPYRLTHLEPQRAELQRFDSISAAMDTFYSAAPKQRGDPLAAERRALLAPLDRAAAGLERRVAALDRELQSGESQRDPLRAAGELVLTHQAALPLGSTTLDADGVAIELDPKLTAVENAQAYFARYRKAREAAERVPALVDTARHELEHVQQLRTLVDVADSMDAIRALRREVSAIGGSGASKSESKTKSTKSNSNSNSKPTPTRAPYRRVKLDDAWEALIGTSAAGNAAVTFDLARPDDLWLHARNVPGAHVILRGPSANPPDPVLEQAASLAAWHSAARTSGQVEVDVAPRRHVRKIPNAPPGLVRYSNERTLRVSPNG